jgi:hypothetical protein
MQPSEEESPAMQKLKTLGYTVSFKDHPLHGAFRQIENGEGFKWVDQKHYELFARATIEYI